MAKSPLLGQFSLPFDEAKEARMPKGSVLCPDCQHRNGPLQKCECGQSCCEACRLSGDHKDHWIMHDLWWATMRKAMLLNRKPGQGLAVTKDGAKMHLGGRPQKQYSPIMGRDLNKFLAGIASQQERSVIGHSRTRDY